MVSYTYQALDLGFMAMIVEIGLMKNFVMVRNYDDEIMYLHTLKSFFLQRLTFLMKHFVLRLKENGGRMLILLLL